MDEYNNIYIGGITIHMSEISMDEYNNSHTCGWVSMYDSDNTCGYRLN